MRESTGGPLPEAALLAVGGRYDYLIHQLWEHENVCYQLPNLSCAFMDRSGKIVGANLHLLFF